MALGQLFDTALFGTDSLFFKTQNTALTRRQRSQIATARAEWIPGFLGEPHRAGQVILNGAIIRNGGGPGMPIRLNAIILDGAIIRNGGPGLPVQEGPVLVKPQLQP
ncbi:MAG: hypothetical protein HY290_02855 [Planctomycetia bacterium]|nr:hypothetical protein [Planctomycetia bacterium]